MAPFFGLIFGLGCFGVQMVLNLLFDMHPSRRIANMSYSLAAVSKKLLLSTEYGYHGKVV